MQQCNGCGRWNWPAVWRCGECGSWEHGWHQTPLTGRVFTWTRTWHDFGAPRDFTVPYVSVVVELDGAGQRRVVGTLRCAADTDIPLGAAVRGEIRNVQVDGGELPGLSWELVPAQQQGEVRA
jgi:uncharacterized OB-fold protein